jgi:DNA-binding beta-propeller fold protein YncE
MEGLFKGFQVGPGEPFAPLDRLRVDGQGEARIRVADLLGDVNRVVVKGSSETDNKSVYAASQGNSSVVRLTRNTTTGAITQPAGTAGCISEDGSGGTCADGNALGTPFDVAVSPDNKSVYVASNTSNAVVRLNRNTTTGAITQPAGTAGCISDSGTAGSCVDGHGLIGPAGLAVSPNGKSLYVADYSGYGVARLNRAP